MTTFSQSEDINLTIRNEQTRLLYATTPYGASASIITALILSYLEWGFVDHNYIIIWLTSMVIISAIRLGYWRLYKKSKSPNKDIWRYIFIFLTLFTGSIWGSAGIWLFPEDSIIGQSILTLVIGGTAAGAVTVFSYMRITGVGFPTVMLPPLSIHFFLYDQHQYSDAMGLLVALFYIIITSSSLRIHNYTKTNITLSYQSFIDSIAVRASKEAAEKANLAKSTFLSSMSHELRTPLTAIIGYSEILKFEAGPLNEEQMTSVGHVLSAGEHLLGLINEVLDLARIESEESAISVSAIKPGPELELCMSMAKAMSKKYGVTVKEKDSGQYLPDIMADPTRLKQVMINLLSNAIKYNRPGGSVTLVCENNETDKLRIKVIDTGAGIAKSKQEELFIPFSRLGVEGSNIEGTGIGLVITQKLVESMGASLDFESQEGKGSSFWIDVPIVNKAG